MIDRTTSLGVGCYRGGQVCKPGGRPYADAHDSLLAENVNSLSLCRLNLRPKNPEGCQPAVPDNALTTVRHERKLHAVFELQLYHLVSVFAHVVSLHHLRVRIPVNNFNFVVAVLYTDDKGAEVLQWVSQRPTK